MNSYTGGTTISNGTLRAKSAASLAGYGSGTIAVNGTSMLAINAGAATGEWSSTDIGNLLANPNLTFAAGTKFCDRHQ